MEFNEIHIVILISSTVLFIVFGALAAFFIAFHRKKFHFLVREKELHLKYERIKYRRSQKTKVQSKSYVKRLLLIVLYRLDQLSSLLNSKDSQKIYEVKNLIDDSVLRL